LWQIAPKFNPMADFASTSIDIVVPVYRPVQGWAEQMIASMEKLKASTAGNFRLILVSDGNPKESILGDLDILQTKMPGMIFIESSPNRGKGFAVRRGLAASTAAYSVVTDVDFPFTTASMALLIRQLMQGSCDLVLGQRDRAYYAQISPFRRRLSRGLTWLNQHLFRLPVRDTQCGLKGMNATGRGWFLKTTIDRYLFDLELVFLIRRAKELKVCTTPVQLNPGVTLSSMRFSVLFAELMNLVKIIWKQW
jgi:glycosyltransferase involved in cell wall biosynthesis